MVDIIFPTSTAPGARPGEGSGRLINCYAERLDDGARAQYARRRAPGLKRLANTTRLGIRGLHYHNGDLYVAQANRLSRVNLVGGIYVVTDLGALPGTQRVTFARNNKAPVPDIICVTENDTYVVNRTTPAVSLADGDLPQALTVDFLDGYFIFAIRDGRFFVSGINDKTINALDFGKAESKTGGLLRAVSFGEQLVLFGPSVIEFWQNVGNATGSPFSRASTFPLGLASTFAIAGNELGFKTLVFVGSDNGVYRLDGGYQPSKISTPDLDRLIEKVTDKTQLEVTVHVTSAKSWATVTGPTFSWTCDLGAGFWHERKSYLETRWRALCSVQAFDGWVVGDRETGEIWLVDPQEMTEGGHPLSAVVHSLPLAGFPNRAVIPRADFDFIVGQGLVAGQEPIETDPVVLLSWSDDGGNTFKQPLKRSLGRHAEHKTTVSINRSGMASRYGRVWQAEIIDPVYVSLLSGTLEGTPRSR